MQNFRNVYFVCRTRIRNVQKLALYESFLLYGMILLWAIKIARYINLRGNSCIDAVNTFSHNHFSRAVSA